MKTTLFTSAALLAASMAAAQNSSITIPATDGALPAGGSNGCAEGYYPGSDTVIFTVPYTYKEVISIIGNYTNLTWSGSPDNSVTTNNSAALKSNDWTPGTARFYDVAGAHVIETITTYDKPADNGPYIEIHTLAPIEIPAAGNVRIYGDYDAVNYTSVCDGKAMWANYTINFCATNASVAAATLHQIHLTDAMTVAKFLGGENFTSCEALGASGMAPVGGWGGSTGMSNETTPTTGSPNSTYSSPPAQQTNAAMSNSIGNIFGVVGLAAAFVAFSAL